MRHLKKKKIGKGASHRRKLLKSLASSAILYEKIITSNSQAKAARSYLEKLITKAKANTLPIRRQLQSQLSFMAAKKLVEVLGPKYRKRTGGYTRLVKLNRPESGKSQTLLELIE